MLRDFQQERKTDIYGAWADGAFNIMPVLPTGGGKTVLFCDIVRDFDQPACTIAHRQELVSQAALALNREKVPHAIIAQKQTIQQIIALENELQGYSCYNSRAVVRAAGVDTIIRRDPSDRWFSQVGLVVQDEGHHVLQANKWGTAQLMFPNARGLFPTAHAVRADRKGLGRDADGLVDRLSVGPCARELINRGYLTDYDIYCPANDIDFDSVPIGPSGELNMPKLRAVTHKSNQLVGDVVKSYLKWAYGKLGVTFAVDKESAVQLRAAYNAAGVPAEIITDETPITVRGKLMRMFRAREILQLISVDCLGEGVDVPAIEVVSFARKTASWQLFCQQFGRSLRVLVDAKYWDVWDSFTDDERRAIIVASSKPKAIIIDHVGNVLWHAQIRGLPDSPQEYGLIRGEGAGRGKSLIDPLRGCLFCFKPYRRFLVKCPHCGKEPPVTGRATPEAVDGDLILLDPQVLAALRGDVDRVNGPVHVPQGLDSSAQRGYLRNHHDRYRAQQELQRILRVWGGWQETQLETRAAQKLFFIRFGVDVMTAMTLNAADANALQLRVIADLVRNNVTEIAA